MSFLRNILFQKTLFKHRSAFTTKNHFLKCYDSQVIIFNPVQQQRNVSVTPSQKLKDKKVSITFINRKGDRIPVEVEENKSLLDIAKDLDLDLEGFGICDGTVSCSTCHVIFNEDDFNKIGRAKSDDEKDMLDMALGRTDTSRLGCQIVVTKALDGLVVKLPSVVSDAREL